MKNSDALKLQKFSAEHGAPIEVSKRQKYNIFWEKVWESFQGDATVNRAQYPYRKNGIAEH